MLGYKKCLICRKDIQISNTEAEKQGWGRLILRNNSIPYKYAGMVCPECSKNKIKPLYYSEKE